MPTDGNFQTCPVATVRLTERLHHWVENVVLCCLGPAERTRAEGMVELVEAEPVMKVSCFTSQQRPFLFVTYSFPLPPSDAI